MRGNWFCKEFSDRNETPFVPEKSRTVKEIKFHSKNAILDAKRNKREKVKALQLKNPNYKIKSKIFKPPATLTFKYFICESKLKIFFDIVHKNYLGEVMII